MNLGRTTVNHLSTYGERLEFAVKYQILGIFWLLFLIFNIILKRNKLNALNPLAGRDKYFKMQ